MVCCSDVVPRMMTTFDASSQDVLWVEDGQRQQELDRVLRNAASSATKRTLVFVNQKASAQEVSRALERKGFKNR